MTKVLLLFNVIFSILWPEGRAEVVLGTETDEFDFDGLPGAQHEFKIEVGAGKEECFYQKIVAGGKLHISFEVSIKPLLILTDILVFYMLFTSDCMFITHQYTYSLLVVLL